MSDTVCKRGDKRGRTVAEVGERRGNNGDERFGSTCRFLLSLIDERWKSVRRRLAGGSSVLLLELLF